MVKMQATIEKADGGFIIHRETDGSERRIFLKLSDAINDLENFFADDENEMENPRE